MQQTSQDLVSVGGMPSTSRVFAFNQALALGQPIELDLSQYSNQNRLANVQGAFLDNSAGTAPFSFSCGGGQTITIPAGYQGFFPIYWNATYICKLSGSGVVNITLVNFPTPAAVWNANAAGAAQSVIDVNLAQAMQAGMVKTVPQFLSGDGSYLSGRVADKVASGKVVDTTKTQILGINSTGYFIKSIQAMPSAGAGGWLIFSDNSGEVLRLDMYNPAGWNLTDLHIVGAGPISVSLDVALTNGQYVFYAVTGANVSS